MLLLVARSQSDGREEFPYGLIEQVGIGGCYAGSVPKGGRACRGEEDEEMRRKGMKEDIIDVLPVIYVNTLFISVIRLLSPLNKVFLSWGILLFTIRHHV